MSERGNRRFLWSAPPTAQPAPPVDVTGLPFLQQAWATPQPVTEDTTTPDPPLPPSSRSTPGPWPPATPPADQPVVPDSVADPDSTHRWPLVDWATVRRIRAEAAERRDAQSIPDPDVAREYARDIVTQLVDDEARRAVASGDAVLTPTDMRALAAAAMDSLYGLGRFQPLVDIPTVENVEIRGWDTVILEHHDSVLQAGPPVADSDAELLETVQLLASQLGAQARPFNHGAPFLNLSLPGNIRLTATNWVTERPQVWLRLHRLPRLSMNDAVNRSMVTETMAAFLSAAVKASMSIVVCGGQSAGKTTFMRALAQEIPPAESIVTVEGERELFIDKLPAYTRVTSVETRPGTGELDQAGRPLGLLTADEAILQSLRMNANRIIVGEVRGPEITAMVKVMESGPGGMATTHAKTARHAVGRLATLIQEAQPATSYPVARRKLAEQLQLIVHLDKKTVPHPDGTTSRRRFVSEIVAVEPSETGDVAMTTIFGPDAGPLPPWLAREVADYGYDPRHHDGSTR
jgi:pilus assembly protein CpaF